MSTRLIWTSTSTAYSQQLGHMQRVGYVNELLARLTHRLVSDRTQTNGTLDSDGETFPLGRGIYADFSHDNEMVAIYAAVGRFRQGRDLAVGSRGHSLQRGWWLRGWIVGRGIM